VTKPTKPLILAIEPDPQQAAQLRSVAGRVKAELLLVQSADRALATLDERVPDLILTPLLLSRRDELALTDRLRELGDVTAHIQTLTIPILETGESKRGGMLSALRRDKARAGQAGCDAEIFAEQVSIYLQQAAGSRRTSAAPVAAAQPAPAPSPTVQAEPSPDVEAEPEPPESTEPWAEPVAWAAAEPEPAVSPAAQPEPAPSMATQPEPAVLLAAQPEPAVPLAAAPETSVALVPRRAVSAELPPVFEPPSLPENMIAAVSSVLHALEVPDNATVIIPANLLAQWRASVEGPLHHAASNERTPNDVPPDAVSVGLASIGAVASVVSAAAPSPTVPVDVSAEDLSADDLYGNDLSANDVQAGDGPADEVSVVMNDWRFFDPEQSRFAALLAKLDELAAAGA
jgi:CheY-like chemotaxis protein